MLVQTLRLQRGWSQEQLAHISGLSTRTIQRLESGKSASLESLTTMAAVFEIDLSELHNPKEISMTDNPTNTLQTSQQLEALAFARVRRVKSFYIHLWQYLAVIALLAIINFVTSPGSIWVIWPALGWGTAVLIHALSTFDKIPFLNAEWEKKTAERYLGRDL